MTFDIITIFPEIFKGFTSEALIARAQKKNIASIRLHNLRRWTNDPHKSVDDRPYGGGAGMVMMVKPLMRAIASLKSKAKSAKKSRVIVMSAKGKRFDQNMARQWAKLDQLIIICGRYEGIDERVNAHLADEEISIGDYVLFGGEVPAMAIMEAVMRLLPGAVGKQESVQDESFNKVAGMEKLGMLEYPHYTRPEQIKIAGKTRAVPKVLLSGNHQNVEEWRRKQSYVVTKKRRPDLLNVKFKNLS